MSKLVDWLTNYLADTREPDSPPMFRLTLTSREVRGVAGARLAQERQKPLVFLVFVLLGSLPVEALSLWLLHIDSPFFPVVVGILGGILVVGMAWSFVLDWRWMKRRDALCESMKGELEHKEQQVLDEV